MRNYIDIICEASVPLTTYGYWISQYSEIYPVGDHDHERFIRSVERCTSAEAIMSGWVRVVTVKGAFQAEANFSVLKPRVKAKLVALARDADYSMFLVDDHNDSGEYTVNRYANIHEFLHGIEALARA